MDMRAHVGPVARRTWRERVHYTYDDFYFLADPDEFIFQFRADDERLQLLQTPISLDQFERLPYVYSHFFNRGLEFQGSTQAVLYADDHGVAEVKLGGCKDKAFDYELWFADRERNSKSESNDAALERFVMHSLAEDRAVFRLQLPKSGSYILRVSLEENDQETHNRLLRFVCVLKVVCQKVVGNVHPLPNCASGEWGPSKGERHFGLKAMTHITGVVSVDNDLEMKFQLPRKLHFLCKLRMNGVEDSMLEKFVNFSVYDDILTVKVKPPQAGQYGLDIYARPEDADDDMFAHACKYLLNVTRVNTITIDLTNEQSRCSLKDNRGSNDLFQLFDVDAVPHLYPTKTKIDKGILVVEIGLSEAVQLSHSLMREPDEDCRKLVSIKSNAKKVKFSLSFHQEGVYLFAVTARKTTDPGRDAANICNYIIRYALEKSGSTLNRKIGILPSRK